ncbi:MAG: alcohol dehydrogenase catalytic domain-containing protein [bacterium]|nr:alcohol dehydrogenase catalytic domain-containing protein [bacterium]
MRGLLIRRGEVVFTDDLPRPDASRGECRVRVLRAGVCATDLALQRGYMGFEGVPGHEFVGEALDGELAGARVVGEINAGCGTCADCRAGDPRHCTERSVLGILGRAGAFAEELSLPAANLHPVPHGVSTDAATFAEPLAAAFQIPAEVDVTRFERALVLGDGRLGLLCAQVLAQSGLGVSLFGRHPERAAFLPSGITYVQGEPRPCGLVVEATGDPGVLRRALELTLPKGTLVLKTTSEAAVPLDLAPLVIGELTLVGSRCGPFAPALAALDAGSVEVEAMIDARFPLERGPEALATAARPGVLKVLIEVAERGC